MGAFVLSDVTDKYLSPLGKAPKQIRRLVPRVLAYEIATSSPCEPIATLNAQPCTGHGWIAMTRLPGSPLSDVWQEFDLLQRETLITDLAKFTRKLSRFKTWEGIGSVVIDPTQSDQRSLRTSNLLLPKRHGANNLRPTPSLPHPCDTTPLSTEQFLLHTLNQEIAFVRAHQSRAARCFNGNVVRLGDCGMLEELIECLSNSVGGERDRELELMSSESPVYVQQLEALSHLVTGIVGSGSIPFDSSARSSSFQDKFVLAHLDLSLDNLLVDPETGTLTGVVDWEFAGSVPLWIAEECPPWVNGSDQLEDARLRSLWEEHVYWEEYGVDVEEKRMAWKVSVTSEWTSLKGPCEWAKERVLRSLSQENSAQPSLSLRSTSPLTDASSLGPETPVDALPTFDLPKVAAMLQYPTGDDSDDEESVVGQELEDDFDFELEFGLPEIPHVQTSFTIQVSTPVPKARRRVVAPSHPPKLPKDCIYHVFWQTAQVKMEDLEFVVERDLDAGW